MISTLLIVHLITTTVFGIFALVSTTLVIYRLFKSERARLNDAETHAFRLLDEMLRSLLPRNLGKRLSELYKAEAKNTSKNKSSVKKVHETPTANEPDYENVGA